MCLLHAFKIGLNFILPKMLGKKWYESHLVLVVKIISQNNFLKHLAVSQEWMLKVMLCYQKNFLKQQMIPGHCIVQLMNNVVLCISRLEYFYILCGVLIAGLYQPVPCSNNVCPDDVWRQNFYATKKKGNH